MTIGFTRDRYTYKESSGRATVTVVLTGHIDKDVNVQVRGGTFLPAYIFMLVMTFLLCPTVSSTQTNVSDDKVSFRTMTLTFSRNDPKEQNVSTAIVDDKIALEDDEIVRVLIASTPPAGVMFGITNTNVTIIDDDRELQPK